MNILQKHRSRIHFLLYLLVISGLFFFQTSCEDEEECTIPRIDSVTFRDSLSRIDYVVPGKVLTIHGENLNSISAMYINSQALNTLYLLSYESSITFLVPSVVSSIPEEEMTDSIRVIKTCGEAMITVNILSPPPQITSLSNEYAIAGDTLFIFGKYFSLLESVTFPGDLEGQILDDYTDTTCSVIVPGGVLNQGEIVLTSKSGTGSTAFGVEYRDRSGLVCNFDDVDTYTGDASYITSSGIDPAIAYTNGYFFFAEASHINPGSEVVESSILPLDIPRNFNYPGNLTPEYFALKMEMFFKYPWTSGAYWIEIGKKDESDNIEYAYRFDLRVSDLDSTTYYLVGSEHWKTMSAPLSEFKLVGSDDIYLQSYAQLKAVNYMTWEFQNTDESDEETIENLGIGIDNIRIIQIEEEE
jgi:hypothetical protein